MYSLLCKYFGSGIHNTVTDTLCLNVLEFAVLGPLRHLVDLALLVPNVEDGELLLVAVLSYTKPRGLKSTNEAVCWTIKVLLNNLLSCLCKVNYMYTRYQV
jgi:hypothetical protein